MSSPSPVLSELMELIRATATAPPTAAPVGGTVEGWQIMLTPELAAWLLENNEGNRRLSTREVDRIAADIAAGRWQLNGDTIKITESSRLGDGQHRCQAVIQSGIAVPTMIVFGVSDAQEVTATIDTTGRSRSVCDIYQITTGQHADAAQLAATNLLGHLSGGVDLGSKPLQYEHLIAHIDEISPWLSWADGISKASPLVVNPMYGRGAVRSIGKTPLAVLAVHMVRAGADPDTVREFYAGMVGNLPPAVTRELTDNQLAALQAMTKRLRGGRMLNRFSGSAYWTILAEYAVHIVAYSRWVTGARMELARSLSGSYRYLGELPIPTSATRTSARAAQCS